MERMTYDEFKATLRACKRAWHLELRDTYHVAIEDEPFRRFLEGEPDDYAWRRSWLSFIREVSGAGVVVQRLRLVSVPHTDYTRWGLALAPQNIAAGEEVRYLRRERAEDIELPPEDCWLFDDNDLVLSVFSDDGRTGGFTRESNHELTDWYRQVRDPNLAESHPTRRLCRQHRVERWRRQPTRPASLWVSAFGTSAGTRVCQVPGSLWPTTGYRPRSARLNTGSRPHPSRTSMPGACIATP